MGIGEDSPARTAEGIKEGELGHGQRCLRSGRSHPEAAWGPPGHDSSVSDGRGSGATVTERLAMDLQLCPPTDPGACPAMGNVHTTLPPGATRPRDPATSSGVASVKTVASPPPSLLAVGASGEASPGGTPPVRARALERVGPDPFGWGGSRLTWGNWVDPEAVPVFVLDDVEEQDF